MAVDRNRVRNAWLGRISGCELGKPVEGLSMRRGHEALRDYLARAGALPLRDYVPFREGELPDAVRPTCRGHLQRAEKDDDINYAALALLMLEKHGLALSTADVAREWLLSLPAGQTWTAERAAIPAAGSLELALDRAIEEISGDSAAAEAVRLGH